MASKLQVWNRAARAAGETQRIEALDDTGVVAATLADVFEDLAREAFTAREWSWATVQSPLTEVSAQSISYLGDGGQVDFRVPYDIGPDASQLTVTVNGVLAVLGAGYTYTPPTDGFSAKATFIAAPAAASTVVLTVTTTRVGWDFVFTMPDDCVRPLALLCQGERRADVQPRYRTPFAVVPNNGRTGYLICANTDQFTAFEYVAFVVETSMWPAHFVEAVVLRLAAHLLDAVKKSPGEAMAMMQRYEAAVGKASAVANNGMGQPPHFPSPGLAARGGHGFFGRGSPWRGR